MKNMQAPTGYDGKSGINRPVEIAAHFACLRKGVNKPSRKFPTTIMLNTRRCSPLAAQDREPYNDSVRRLLAKKFFDVNDFFFDAALGVHKRRRTAR